MSTELLVRFAQYLRASDRSENTVEPYLRDLCLFREWFESSNGEQMKPEGITPIDVKEYKTCLLQVKGFKPATVSRRLASISAFCEWARRGNLIETNPREGIGNVPQVELAPGWLTRKEQYALLRAVQKEGNPRDEAVIMLLLHTGLRVGEPSNLRLSDIEISERKGLVTVRDGKAGKHRVIPLNVDARRALTAYLQVRPEATHDYLFVGKQCDRLKPCGIQYVASKYAYLARLDDVTPHTLRHTFGKNLVDAGVSLDKVATLLGHENLNTTRLYTKPNAADLAQAVEKLEMR
jgi:integrase/recombinase XerD